MIDADIIDALNDVTQDAVADALTTLAMSGIIDTQLKRKLDQLTSGADDESEENLARRIRVYRRDVSQLMSLKELAERFSKGDEV